MNNKYLILKELNSLKKIQKENLDNGAPYMVGLYNGIELCNATIKNRDAKFKSINKKYLNDKRAIPKKSKVDLEWN